MSARGHLGIDTDGNVEEAGVDRVARTGSRVDARSPGIGADRLDDVFDIEAP